MVSEFTITFERDKLPDAELRNFSPPEQGFVWTSGRWAELVFAFPIASTEAHGEACEIILDLDVYKAPPQLEAQNVFFYLNGLRVGSRLIERRSTVFLDCPPHTLKVADNLLAIDTPDSAKPSSFGGSDGRLLGIQLFSMQTRKVSGL